MPSGTTFYVVIFLAAFMEISLATANVAWSTWSESSPCDGCREFWLMRQERKYVEKVSPEKTSSLTIVRHQSCPKDGECRQKALISPLTFVCPNRTIHWLPSIKEKRVDHSPIALKRGMDIISCREFCFITKDCAAANFHEDGLCELMSTETKQMTHTTSVILTYECCDEVDNSTCILQSIPVIKYVCPNNFIHWHRPIPESFVDSEFLAVKVNQSVQSCQQFCHSTPGCLTANYRTNGDCMLMKTTTPISYHPEMSLLTYRCCQSVHGGWSEWSEYSTCRMNTTIRTRKCNNPLPSGSGSNCIGMAYEMGTCVVHGGWSEWSEYSTCRMNTTIRTRKCNNPLPSGSGSNCIGMAYEMGTCVEEKPKFSYTAAMRRRAETERFYGGTLTALLCSDDGEFDINFNIPQGLDWKSDWSRILNAKDWGMLFEVMFPQELDGVLVWMVFFREGSNIIMKSGYDSDDKTPNRPETTLFQFNIHITVFDKNGEPQTISRENQKGQVIESASVILTIPSQNWTSFHLDKLPILRLQLIENL